MGAETGATCSLFGFDKAMADFLSSTGRREVAELASNQSDNLTGDAEVYAEPEKYFDQVIEIDLSSLEPYINGPFTPDRAIPVSQMKVEAAKNGWPLIVEAGLIGSCTNSSYEDISRAASVVSNALSQKLIPKAELIVIPGSERIRVIAERDGFMDIFREAGSEVFANACGPCIGQWDRKGSDKNEVNTVIHSFNRNFAKRTDGNPNTHAFVASPEIVAAIAFSGNIAFNPLTDTLTNSEGREVKLSAPVGIDLPPNNISGVETGYQEPVKTGNSNEIMIAPDSERLQALVPFNEWDGSDFSDLPLLIKAKGKCTTDHISMAGFWLKYRGHLENISKNYMIGAVNFFNDKTNLVLNQLSKEYDRVPSVAIAYKTAGIGSVVAGEENFGEGSSREHAAMEPRYLNVKVVIVKSFARIHETNLKKQGVLTLTFSDNEDYGKIREDDRFDISGLKGFAPGKQLDIVLKHSDGSINSLKANHSYNETQIAWFKAGSALNIFRKSSDKS
jgi:aconitate hydratase